MDGYARSVAVAVTSNLKSYTMAEASHGGVDRSAESFSKFKRYIECNVIENPIGGEGMP